MPSTFFGLIGMIFLIFIAWEVIATLLLCLAAWSQSREYERGFERGREDAALYSHKPNTPDRDHDHDARL